MPSSCADRRRFSDTYLSKLVSGEWTGTMNLTEPQAGSDLAAVRTRAVPTDDGRYLLTGQKIFITYGEHDLTDNIVHLVLARIAGAPDGVKGMSLFVVPKFLVNADGSAGRAQRCSLRVHRAQARDPRAAPPAFWPSGRTAAPWASSSARRIAGWNTCSS